jgi:hypothetical protein
VLGFTPTLDQVRVATFIGQASQSPSLFSQMIAIEKKLPETSGQVSQVLEGMDKLNAKVEDFM